MYSLALFAMGEANRHKQMKVFDWDRAASLIREHKPEVAEAGLAEDWRMTSGEIYCEGVSVVDHGAYLASTWATPTLFMNGDHYDCYRMESETPKWDAQTSWPQSSLDILKEV